MAPLAVIFLAVYCITPSNGQVFSILDATSSPCTASSSYFDFGTLQCLSCEANMTTSSSGYSCACSDGYKADINNVRVLTCSQCPNVTTPDGYFCATCLDGRDEGGQCVCGANQELTIASYTENSIAQCDNCFSTNLYNTGNLNCVPCPECCDGTGTQVNDLCFTTAFASAQRLSTLGLTSPSLFIETNLGSAYGACIADTTLRNQTACEQLANMCVMEQIETSREACTQYSNIATGVTDGASWQSIGVPWLLYSSTNNDQIQNDDSISASFPFDSNSVLDFVVARYRANGTFLGVSSVTDGLIQLCKDAPSVMNAAYVFGTTFQSSCSLDVASLLTDSGDANIYFDMFLRYTSGSEIRLYPVPVLVSNYLDSSGNEVNSESDSTQWQFVRRFFLVDNIYTIQAATATPTTVRYAQSMEIEIRLQPSSPGTIFPPVLRMSYQTVDAATTAVQTTFSVTYSSSTFDQNEGIKISMSVLGVLAFLYAVIESSGWRRRQGLPYVELSAIAQFALFFMANVANVFFIVMLGYTTVLLLLFKGQNTATSYVPANDSYEAYLFMVFLVTAYACKLLQIIVLIFKQSFIDIFFVDWERPRAKDGSQKVSIWRTYFIANEWNEIQTCRKINSTFQLFAVLLFLEVIGFKNLALLNSSSDLNPSDDSYQPPFSNLLRFAVGGLVYLVIAIVQVIYFKFIHGRFISDKIRDFIDLCSVSNVSVFILSQTTFGYYIHGRSVHGRADTDMAEMGQMLRKEGEGLAPKRGLLTETEEQVFEIAIPLKMRNNYNKVYQPLQLMKNQTAGRGGGARGDNLAAESWKAYNTMKTFLSSFIDHSLKDLDYITKEKVFLERVLGIEFQEPIDTAFFRTGDEDAFADILFYGREVALLLFDILMFSLVDYGSTNFVLAAVITYLVGGILRIVRNQLGRHNLAKKTLIDKRFLI